MLPGSSSPSERLRIWLERGEAGYWLRDATSGDAMKWDDPRVRVVKLAGATYRADALQDDAFAPGERLALVREPENEHDSNAIAVYDAERRLQAGYVPAEHRARASRRRAGCLALGVPWRGSAPHWPPHPPRAGRRLGAGASLGSLRGL